MSIFSDQDHRQKRRLIANVMCFRRVATFFICCASFLEVLAADQWRWRLTYENGEIVSPEHYEFRKNLYKEMWEPYHNCRDDLGKILKAIEDSKQRAKDIPYEVCIELEPNESEYYEKVKQHEGNT